MINQKREPKEQYNYSKFKVEELPYLYHNEFRNIGFNTRGFYLDSNGNRYEYSLPELDLNTVADERLNQDKSNNLNETVVTVPSTEYTVKPIELFASLIQCTVSRSDLKLELTDEVIDDLHNAPIIELEQLVMDAGWSSKSLLIYLPKLDLYKRILLESIGNVNKVNLSSFTRKVLESVS